MLVALGFALLGSAYERTRSDGVPPPSYGDYRVVQLGCSSIFSSCDTFDPTPWYVAGTTLTLVAALLFVVAARRRAGS